MRRRFRLDPDYCRSGSTQPLWPQARADPDPGDSSRQGDQQPRVSTRAIRPFQRSPRVIQVRQVAFQSCLGGQDILILERAFEDLQHCFSVVLASRVGLAGLMQFLQCKCAAGLQKAIAWFYHPSRPRPATCQRARPAYQAPPIGRRCSRMQRAARCPGRSCREHAPSRRNRPVCSCASQQAMTPSSAARSVWWRRSPMRAPPVKTRKRSSSRVRSRRLREAVRVPRPALSPVQCRPGAGRCRLPPRRCAQSAQSAAEPLVRVLRKGRPPPTSWHCRFPHCSAEPTRPDDRHIPVRPSMAPGWWRAAARSGRHGAPHDQFSNGEHQMLAIVEHDQHVARAQRLDQTLDLRVGAERDAQGSGHGGRNQRRVGHRRELDNPDAVIE